MPCRPRRLRRRPRRRRRRNRPSPRHLSSVRRVSSRSSSRTRLPRRQRPSLCSCPTAGRSSRNRRGPGRRRGAATRCRSRTTASRRLLSEAPPVVIVPEAPPVEEPPVVEEPVEEPPAPPVAAARRQRQRRSQRRDVSFRRRSGFASRNRAGRRNQRARSRRPNVLRSRSRAWCSRRRAPAVSAKARSACDWTRSGTVTTGWWQAQPPRPAVHAATPDDAGHAWRAAPAAVTARAHAAAASDLLVQAGRAPPGNSLDRRSGSGRPADSTVPLFSAPRGLDVNGRRRPRCRRRLLLLRQSRGSSRSPRA